MRNAEYMVQMRKDSAICGRVGRYADAGIILFQVLCLMDAPRSVVFHPDIILFRIKYQFISNKPTINVHSLLTTLSTCTKTTNVRKNWRSYGNSLNCANGLTHLTVQNTSENVFIWNIPSSTLAGNMATWWTMQALLTSTVKICLITSTNQQIQTALNM